MWSSLPRLNKTATRVILTYLGLSGLWILASDSLVELVYGVEPKVTWFQTAKGLAFVVVTSLLLYLALLRSGLAGDRRRAAHVVKAPNARLPLVGFALLTLGLLLTGWFTFHGQRDQLRANAEANLRAVGGLKVEEIGHWLASVRANAHHFGHGSQVAEHFAAWLAAGERDDGRRARVLRRLDQISTDFGYQSISLFDREGRYRLSDHPDPQMAEHGVDALSAMASGKAVLVDFHNHGLAGGEPMLGMVAPLMIGQDGDTRCVGAIFFAIPARNSLLSLLKQWPGSSVTGETLLARREGNATRLLFASQQIEAPEPALAPPREIAWVAATAEPTAMRGILANAVDYRMKPVLAYGSPIESTPWILITKQDLDEVNAPVDRLALTTTLVTAFLLAGLAVGFRMWWMTLLNRQRAQLLGQELERQVLERHFDYLSRYANDAILLLDAGGVVLKANDRTQDMYGQAVEELTGQPASQLWAPDTRHEIDALLAHLGTAGRAVHEATHQHRDGHRFPVEISGRLIEVEGVSRIHLSMRDISERKRTEERLLMQARVLDQIQDHVTITDLDGVITYVNESECHSLGCPLEDLIGRHVTLYGDHPKADARRDEIVHATLEAGSWRGNVMHTDADGKEITVDLRTSLIRGTDGAALCMVGIGTDITERLRVEQALKEREALYRNVLDTATDGFWVVEMGGRLIEVNDAYARVSGYSRDELLEMRVDDLEARENPEEILQHIQRVMEIGNDLFETRHRRKDGGIWEAELNTSHSPLAGGRIFAFIRDITQRKRTEEKLRASEERYRLIADNVNDVIWLLDLATRRFTYVSPSVERLRGYPPDEVMAAPLEAALTPESAARVETLLAANLARIASGDVSANFLTVEVDQPHRDGHIVHTEVTTRYLFDAAGQPDMVLGVSRDITERKRNEARLEQATYYDPLTGAPNARWMLDQMAGTMAEPGPEAPRMALLVLNIDRFAQLNETLGREAGDQVLVELAQRWRLSLPESCLLGRMEADQFTVLAPQGGDGDAIAEIASGLMNAIREPILLDAGGKSVSMNLSIGIALYPGDAPDAPALLHAAEDAMREAKAEKGNQVRFFDHRQAQAAIDWFETENALRQAMARDEFFLLYQPQADAATGRIVAVEALIRWRRDGMVVPPGRFIGVVEGTDLARPVSRWVLATACRQARQWLDRERPVRVAVNIFSDHVTSGHLLDDVREALDYAGLPPHLLELEVVESSLLKNPEAASATLRGIKRLGVGLALDDFGTGYSSLGYLKHYPFDVLKIDQIFARNVTRDPDDAAIVRSTIALAHNLGMRVLAEGVETEPQLRFMARYGCNHIQGYLLSHPTTAEEVETHVMERRDMRPAGLSRTYAASNVLVIEDDHVEATRMSFLLDEAGYRAFLADDLDGALAHMGRERIDLVIADHYLADTTGVEVLERLRRLFPDIPRIMASSSEEQAVVMEAVNRAGIRAFLAKPVMPETLLATLRGILGADSAAR